MAPDGTQGTNKMALLDLEERKENLKAVNSMAKRNGSFFQYKPMKFMSLSSQVSVKSTWPSMRYSWKDAQHTWMCGLQRHSELEVSLRIRKCLYLFWCLPLISNIVLKEPVVCLNPS